MERRGGRLKAFGKDNVGIPARGKTEELKKEKGEGEKERIREKKESSEVGKGD